VQVSGIRQEHKNLLPALTGAEGALPFGIARVVAGLGFAFGGGQIFTDDVLMVMGSAKLVAD